MLDEVANVRDLGGLPASEGMTRPGVLVRSAGLGELTDRGRHQLTRLSVGTVVDLRTSSEGPADDLPNLEVIRLPLLEGAWDLSGLADGAVSAQALATIPTLPDLYAGMISNGGPTFARLAAIVAGSDHAVLIHCTAGKDRTGVAVALLLDAVGTDRSAVVADYAASHDQLSGVWADGMRHALARLGVPDLPEIDALMTASPASAIESVLDRLDAHGGSLAYLTGNGLSEDDAVRLRERLVEPPPVRRTPA